MDARNDFGFIFDELFGGAFMDNNHDKELDDLWSSHNVDAYYKEFFKLQSLGYRITRDSDGKHKVVKLK